LESRVLPVERSADQEDLDAEVVDPVHQDEHDYRTPNCVLAKRVVLILGVNGEKCKNVAEKALIKDLDGKPRSFSKWIQLSHSEEVPQLYVADHLGLLSGPGLHED